MIIRYFDGSYVEGAIRRLEGATLRVAITGIDHTVEYKLVQGRWTSRTGVLVTFEFPAESGMDLLNDLPGGIAEGGGHCATGGDCALRRMSAQSAGPVN